MPEQTVDILYVDDDDALVRLVAKACQRRGYTLTHAADVPQGLRILKDGAFSLVVLDHDLRTDTGLDFLRKIENSEVKPPVIYVTGSAETSVAVSALKAGAFDYVQKSASGDFLELLFRAIEPALERGRLERAKLRAEKEVREARDHAELMLLEVNHRIANSLSLVSSLVRMQTLTVKDSSAIAALNETQVRIQAIGSVHRRLYKSTDIGRVALDVYIRELVEDLQAGISSEGRNSQIELRTKPVTVTTDQTVAVGVIVTELITNAIKYAYPDGEGGQIRISLSTDGVDAVLAVEDDGAGWDGTGPVKGSGLGSRIIKAMMMNLKSELRFGDVPRGTRAFFSFTL